MTKQQLEKQQFNLIVNRKWGTKSLVFFKKIFNNNIINIPNIENINKIKKLINDAILVHGNGYI